MDIKPPNKRDLRAFGLIMAGAIIVLGGIRWWLHGFAGFPVWYCVVAGIFLLAGLLVPESLRPVYWVWMRFALVLNWVITRVVLITIFTLMIIPGRLALLIKRHDPLKREWLNDTETYWEEPEEQPAEFDRYLNQF
jgi:hypothetical protein